MEAPDGKCRPVPALRAIPTSELTHSTVEAETRIAHSLHAYFLRPGDPAIPILYDVDRIRDGRSFTTRRVVAIQHGRAIFNMAVSFHDEEPGLEHQIEMPDTPPPEALPSFEERLAQIEAEHPQLARHEPRPPAEPGFACGFAPGRPAQ